VHCPKLDDLPPPPPDRSGWPWSEAITQLQDTMRDGASWPRISIVTASLNQGRFIEETIRSVLLQGYPNLEYIIIDGGSSDNTVEIVKKYAAWLAHWVTEPDQGQSAALAYGFSVATGDILAWINSDDIFTRGAFNIVAGAFRECDADVVFGNIHLIDEFGNHIGERRAAPYVRLFCSPGLMYGGFGIYQPGAFWTRNIYGKSGGLDRSFHFCMDNDLLTRFALNKANFRFVRKFLAAFRIHPTSKTSTLHPVSSEEYLRLTRNLPRISPLRKVLIRSCCWGWRLLYHTCHLEFGYLRSRHVGAYKWIP